MKTKNLLRKACLLLALVGGINSAWGDTEWVMADWSTSHTGLTYWASGSSADIPNTSTDKNTPAWTDESTYNTYTGTGGSSTFQLKNDVLTNTNRVFSFDVSKDDVISVYFMGGGSGNRSMYVSYNASNTNRDPETAFGSATANGYTPTILTATATSTGTVYLWCDANVRVYAIKVETATPSGKTALTGAWTPTTVSVIKNAEAPSNPSFAVSGGGTLGTDYTVTYSEVSDANNIVTINASDGITAISTSTEGEATIRATVALTETGAESYSMATTTYDITISVIDATPYSAPTITEKNGTVQITSADDGVVVSQIRYSLDNGETWNTYSIPFNLTEATTVKAKVVTGTDPGKADSEVASKSCNAIPAATAGSLSITLFKNNDWTESASSTKIDTWTGKTSTDFEGYVIALDNEGQEGSNVKELSTGNKINSKTTIKGSNGRKLTFTLPAGIKVNRMTIYSYTNGDNDSHYASGWTINGDAADMIGLSLRDIAGNSGKSVSNASNPDVRVFSFDTPLEESFTLNNSGYQQCFYIVLDYTQNISGTLSSTGISTIASAYALDFTNATGVEAYKVSLVSSTSATLEKVTGTVAAGTGLIIVGEENGEYTIPVVAEGSEVASNELVGAVTATTLEDGTFYILQNGAFHLVENTANEAARTVPAGKAYLPAGVNGARAISLSFGGITGISEAAAEVKAAAVSKFVKNGKLVIVKDGNEFNANGQLVK